MDLDRNSSDITDEAHPDPRLFVTSVARAMQILEAFEAGRKSLTIAEIAQRTTLGRSAAQRFVYTLHHMGYLRRDASSKQYRVSPKVLDLAVSLIGTNTFIERVTPVLEQLAEKTGETVAWVELDNLDIVILKSVLSKHLSSVNLPVGQRFAALSSSSGQVLLANGDRAEILRVHRASPDRARARFGLTDEAAVLDYFETIRARGFSVTEKMEDQDSVSISAPVFSARGEAVGAINISTLKTRFTPQQTERILAPSLIEAAHAATKILLK